MDKKDTLFDGSMSTTAGSLLNDDEFLDAAGLARELYDLRLKYECLKDGHRKLVTVNQNLEDKLLQSINRYETEKFDLIHTISSLNLQLDELQRINQRLLAENERFKTDISVAVQLLHCRPSSFSSCKLENLPAEYQSKAKYHMQQESPRYPSARPERKGKVIRVPISAFPSTTVIYSVPSGDDDDREEDLTPADTTVSASTMAKVLEERQRELNYQTQLPSNGTNGQPQCCSPTNRGLHPSRSLSFLSNGDDHHQVVDHGTQTYPNYIGERDKTRNTCIFCHSTQSATHESPATTQNRPAAPPAVEPKVYVYTESETASVIQRNGFGSSTRLANRRKGSNGITASSKTGNGSVETEI